MRTRKMPGVRLSDAERLEVHRRVAQGESYPQVAHALGCCAKSVQRVLKASGGLVLRSRERSALRLAVREREEIALGVRGGESLRAIAARLGRSASTISREVKRNGGRERYRCVDAEVGTVRRARRPKVPKLVRFSRLRRAVESLLERRWSPEQISKRLAVQFPEDPQMRISHETLYQSLFVQARGALRKDLAAHLRSGRTQRRSRGRLAAPNRIKNMVMISQRPAEVADRAVPGHWEGDLLVGARGQSAIVTLVERHTRYVMLARIGRDRSSSHVCAVLAQQIQRLPTHLVQSLTWDQGPELAYHAQFTVDTGVKVYFCDPHSPWQRGSNENTNGLLRQYFPKGTDLDVYDQRQLDEVAHSLNDRPRCTLGWLKPAEKLAQLLQ